MSEARSFDVRGRTAHDAGALSQALPKVLNRERLLEMVGDEPAQAAALLDLFVRSTEGDMNSLAAALESNNSTRVASSAHRVKGASGAIGADLLRREAAQLEEHGHSGELVKAIECFSRLRMEFDRFRTHIAGCPLSTA